MPDSPGLDVPPDLLDLGPDELRRVGHWVVDRTVDHLLTLRDRPGIKRQHVPTQNARTKDAAMAVKQVPSRAGVPEEMA